jgi:hypothetical protein
MTPSTYIKAEELCKFMWNFRFKEAAGEHWLSNDPWWKETRPARVRFFPDGNILLTKSPQGECWAEEDGWREEGGEGNVKWEKG